MNKRMRVLTAVGAAGLFVALSAGQAQAYRGVDIRTSYGHGYGTIWYSNNHNIGFNLHLQDAAADGNCVYFQVQGVRDNNLDAKWERMTGDVCGAGNTYPFSSTHYIGAALGYDGYRVKVCKRINNWPDSCSDASPVTRRGTGAAG